MTTFEYSNLSGRPPGPVVSALGRVLPGVRAVMAQVEPYAAWWEGHNRRAVAAGRPLWVALGDSMTQGIGASAPDRGWVGQLAVQAPPRVAGTEVVNLAFNGARVPDVLERQLPVMQQLADEGHRIPLVTLMVGNNDLVSRRWRTTLNASMRRLLDMVPTGTVVATQPGLQRPARDLNAVIDEAVARRDLVVAEFRDPRMRSWRGRLAQDHFHPNDHGYAGMADVVREALER